MPKYEPIKILLTHDRWATQNIIDSCAKLNSSQFHQDFQIGVGTLHHTITHIVEAMLRWSDLLAQCDPRPQLSEEERTPGQLSDLHQMATDEFSRLALEFPVGELVTGVRGGRSFTFTRGAVVTHVTTHGMHHRAQCLNMLRRLEVEPLPPSSVIEWVLMQDSILGPG